MSRHRNVRTMNYHDEYDGYDDVYGHSVEDDFCCSPGTMEQYGYKRDNDLSLSSFMASDHLPEVDEESSSDDELRDSGYLDAKRKGLSEVENAKLNSCLEEMHSILGESVPERLMVDAVLNYNYDIEKALSFLLEKQASGNSKTSTKSQRDQRSNRSKKQIESSYAAPSHPKATSTPTPKVADSDIAGIASGVTRITFDTPQKVFKTPEPASARKNGATAAENKPQKQLQAAASSRESSAERSLLSTPKRQISDRSNSPANRARGKQSAIDIERELKLRKEKGQDLINLVVIGHVDAGKSTLMGHTLFNLGFVQKRTMQKYEHESKKLGKASFAYAWVLDETEEERSRGVTMDVAQTRFETATKVVTLLDAPGHKDFIPNMITGAAQADCAVLVVNATRGEFETGFDSGGQTREHAMLIRSLGVSQIVVAVNKMDTVDWAQSRFTEITGKLTHFLKQAGFRESDVRYVPCSGLNGENLTTKPEIAQLSWYQGPTLVDTIDTFRAPERDIEKSLRMSVSDVFKGLSGGLSVVATLKAGALTPGTKILVQPQGELATVKSFLIDEGPATCAFAGDSVTCVLTGIDIMNIGVGSILSEPSCPMPVTSRIRARVVMFNIELPITKGFMVVFHYQSLSEPAHIHKLVSQLHKSTGEVIKKKPRCLVKNTSAIIELEIARPICLELYKDYKELGRFMLRYGGATLAAGLVTDILKTKKGKAD